jgi:hypothetical protein
VLRERRTEAQRTRGSAQKQLQHSLSVSRGMHSPPSRLPLRMLLACYLSLALSLALFLFPFPFSFPPLVAAQLQTTSAISVLLTSDQCTMQAARAIQLEAGGGSMLVACTSSSASATIVRVQGSSLTPITTQSQCASPQAMALDAASGAIYAACKAGIVRILNGVVRTVADSTKCNTPMDVRFLASNGTLLAACNGDYWSDISGGIISVRVSSAGAVTVIQLTTARQCSSPTAVVVSSQGEIFASCRSPGVIRIQGMQVSQLASSQQCNQPAAVLLDEPRRLLYASCWQDALRIDLRTSDQTSLLVPGTCETASALSLNPYSGNVQVVCTSLGGVLMLNGLTLAVSQLVDQVTCNYPLSLAFDATTSDVVVGCNFYGSPSAFRIGQVSTITTPFPSTQLPCSDIGELRVGVTFNSETGEVFVACLNNGLFRIDGPTVTPLASNNDCNPSSSMAFDQRSGTLYAVCTISDLRNSLDALVVSWRNGIMLPMDTCSSPTKVALDSYRGVLFVLCQYNAPYLISVNLTDGAVIPLLSGSECTNPTDVTVNEASGVAYVACGYDQVMIVNGTSISSPTIADGCVASAVLAPSVTYLLYVICGSYNGDGASHLISISLTDGSVATLLQSSPAQCPLLSSLTFDEQTLTLFVGCEQVDTDTGGIVSIRGSTISTMGASKICTDTRDVAFNSAAGVLYATCAAVGVVSTSAAPSCFPGFQYRSGTCTACPSGTSRNYSMLQAGINDCAACSPGSVAINTGAVTCDVCEVGKYSASSLLKCQECIPGYYAESIGSAGCQSCPAGSYGSSSGLSVSSCSGFCSPGWWCTAGSSSTTQLKCGGRSVYCPLNSTQPTPVPLGYFSSDPMLSSDPDRTMSSATICPRGSYCDGSGMQKTCPLGTVTAGEGDSKCDLCLPGQSPVFSPLSDFAVCHDCPSGRASADGVSCQDCSPGRAALTNGSVTCEPCSPGTAAGQPGQSLCQNCTIGRFASRGASLACEPCAEGSFAAPASSFCRTCVPGFEPDLLLLTCRPCAAGNFSAFGLSCSSCPAGEVAPRAGLAFCTVCAPGDAALTDSLDGVQRCTACAKGTWSGGGDSCQPCLPGAFAAATGSSKCTPCSQGSASNISALSDVCPQCPPGSYQSAIGSAQCTPCPPLHYSNVPGSISCQLCSTHTNMARTECLSESCQLNHQYSAISGICEPCPLGQAGGGQTCAVCDFG